jgi:hypothetical protein
MAPSGMSALLTHNRTEFVDENGKDVEAKTFSLWLGSEKRIAVFTLTFDPRSAEFCHSTDGRLALNLWKPKPS